MGQCVSHAAGEAGAQDRRPTTAQRISTWPEVPGPMPTTAPKSSVSATLTGGGGLALNVRPSCKTADPSRSPRKDAPLAIIYAHDPGKPTSRPDKSKAVTAALELQEPRVNGGARAAALGAAAARAAATTTAACSSCSGSGKGDVGCEDGGSDGKAVTNVANADFSLDRQSPVVTATELRELSYFARSSRGLDLDPHEDEEGDSPASSQPLSIRPSPGRGPERAWMEPEAAPEIHKQSLQLPEMPAAAGSGEDQVKAPPGGPAATAAQTPAEGSCTEGCSVLGRKSSHFTTPCQDVDGRPEELPDEVAEPMKWSAAAAAAVAAVAVAAAAAAAAAARSTGMVSAECHEGKSTPHATPTVAAGGTYLQRPPYAIEAMTTRDGKGGEETGGCGGGSSGGGGGGGGSTSSGDGGNAAASLNGRWASRLAKDIPSPAPLAQQREQQQASSPSAADKTATGWTPTWELPRNSGAGDYLDLHVRGQGGLSAEVGQGSPTYCVSAPGEPNPLLRRARTNRVRALAATAGISSANTCKAQALVGDAAAPSGKTDTLGHRSDSGMYDPSRNNGLGRLAAARPGLCVSGSEPEVPEVKACSGGAGPGGDSGSSGRRYEHLEVIEAEGEVDSNVPSNRSKMKLLTVAPGIGGEEPGGSGDGNAGAGKGGSKWTRSRAGKTLAMFRMQAAARRVAEDAEKQKQKQKRERLEYVPQTSLQQRVCSPPSTPSTKPCDEDAQNAACDADPLPNEDGIGGARMRNEPAPPPLPLQQQQQQKLRLMVCAGDQGIGSSPAEPPDMRRAGRTVRKVVSERIIWPHGHKASGWGNGGALTSVDEPALYSVPGSTEAVPVQDRIPRGQYGASPPGQFPSQQHDYRFSSQNTLWLYPQTPRHSQPQGPSPPVPPAAQKVHSGPLLKASRSMQQRPPSSGGAVSTQPSLGRQAQVYFQIVSKMQDHRAGSPVGDGGALGPVPTANTSGGGRGISSTEGIVRHATQTHGGQVPGSDITSDRTMRLYVPPSTTTAKAAALMRKQQSGKQIVTAVMPKPAAALTSPPPLSPLLSPSMSPTLSPSALRSPTQQGLQRKDSRLGAGISEEGVSDGAGLELPGSSAVGSHFHAKKHVMSQEVQQLEPTPLGLVGERSWQIGPASKTPCEYEMACGSSEGGFVAAYDGAVLPGLAVHKSRSYRHSEPYWLSTAPPQPPLGLSPPRALASKATMAPQPQPPLSLPGLLPTEEDQRKENAPTAFMAVMAGIDTPLDTASEGAHLMTPLPPPPPLSPPPAVAIGIPAQPQYQAYIHPYQSHPSHQPYIVYHPYQPEAAAVLVSQK